MLIDTLKTFEYIVDYQYTAALEVMILMSISLIFQLVILGTLLYLVYRSWK